MKVYGHADVGRAGLGNLMLPWARCEVFCHQHGLRMLAPQWTQPKIGPLIRGEWDKRYYVGLFTGAGYVSGLSRLAILAWAKRIAETDGDEMLAHSGRRGRPALVVFRGMGEMFQPLLAHRDQIRRRLWEILNPPLAEDVRRDPADFVIGVHVRRGDKPILRFGEPCPPEANDRSMPDEWFINSINGIRESVGYLAPVRIFSDARDEQLEGMIRLGNVSRQPKKPAIVDLLTMSRSRVLITTGTSTFSMWASFLGQMPSLWYPGWRTVLNPEHPGYEAETTLSGDLPDDFRELLAASHHAGAPTASPIDAHGGTSLVGGRVTTRDAGLDQVGGQVFRSPRI